MDLSKKTKINVATPSLKMLRFLKLHSFHNNLKVNLNLSNSRIDLLASIFEGELMNLFRLTAMLKFIVEVITASKEHKRKSFLLLAIILFRVLTISPVLLFVPTIFFEKTVLNVIRVHY
jgi:hypothetical protein